MYKAEDYTYRVAWSEEDGEYVATVAEFPLLSHLDKKQIDALQGIVGVVESALDILVEDGKNVPEPLGKKSYSGRFALRMTPEQHRRVSLEAAESGVSINQLLVSRI